MTIKPFVIWTVQRTGSTSLANILEILSGNTVYHEPFNSDRILPYNGDQELLAEKLSSLEKNPICFKHCWNVHPNWCNELILKQVLAQNYLVLFLHRENMLKVQLSKELAKQTGIWGKKEKEKNNSSVQIQLKPVDILAIKNTLQAYKSEIDYYRNKFKLDNFDFLEVTFEEFFDEEKEFESRLQSLNKICNFIKIENIALEENQDKLYQQLVNNKQNTAKDYEQIPNIQEIKLEFADFTL